MIMLALGLPPNHKLDLYLWEKRLNAPRAKILLRVKRQTVLLIALCMEQFLQRLRRRERGRGRGGPGCDAAVGVGLA